MKAPPEDEWRRLLEPSSVELADTVGRALDRMRRHRPRRERVPLLLALAVGAVLVWMGVSRVGPRVSRPPDSRFPTLTSHGGVVLVVDPERGELLIRGGDRARDGSRAAGRRFLISSRGDE